jgi:hypothetical protein
MPPKKCKFCERRFVKAEHLKRHQRSREYIFIAFCSCCAIDSWAALTDLGKTRARSHTNAPIALRVLPEGIRKSNSAQSICETSDLLELEANQLPL